MDVPRSCALTPLPRRWCTIAVAYQIVREHGGEIRARSEGDWSSILTIYLPVRENTDRRGKPDRRGGRSDRRRRMA